MTKSFIICVYLGYIGIISVINGDNMEKPGKCLPWEGEGPCMVSCQNDWECGGTQKCCSVGCGRMCQNPCNSSCSGINCLQGKQCKVVDGCAQCVSSQQEADTSKKSNQKPGNCFSFLLPKSTGNCTKHCNVDRDCNGTAKCCSSGCSSYCQYVCSGICTGVNCEEGKECKIVGNCAQCVTIDKIKDGKCMKWQGSAPALKNCEKDYDCPNTRKCCPIGEGALCQEPCPTSCVSSLPPCLSGKECQVIDGCAQCVDSTNASPQLHVARNASRTN